MANETKEVAKEPQGLSVADIVGAVASVMAPRTVEVPAPAIGKVKPIPNSVPPGYAVICNNRNEEAKVVECYMICAPSRTAEILPIEGRLRGPVLAGTLIDVVKSGQCIVAMYAPYPAKRSDGRQHLVSGSISYPDETFYTEYNGVYYHKTYGRDYLAAAQAEAKKG